VQFPAIREKVLASKKTFISVFDPEKQEIGVLVPGGPEVDVATFPKGEEFLTPPDPKKKVPGTPKFSPLTELATHLTAPDNRLFSRNIANRMWFVMMGRGLVEPLDLHHGKNPASHPEVLDLLAREVASHSFDLRWLLRELALSETYQRTGLLPSEGEAPPEKLYAVAVEKRMSAEQLFWSTVIATGEIDRLVAALDAAADKSLEGVLTKHGHLGKLRAQFVSAMANPPAEPEIDFEPSVQSALFLMHDGRVLGLVSPQAGNVADRALKLEASDAVADELFLSLLSRPPSDEDRADVAAALAVDAGQRQTAIERLAWALLSSTEFCVNH
jgi:hypothetical protein